MRATVTRPFTDRETEVVYYAGDAYEGTAARVAELEGAGHVRAEKAKQAPRKARAAGARPRGKSK